MVDRVELSNEEQRVFNAVAALESDGDATTADSIAEHAALDGDTVRSVLSRLIEADLVRELDPEAGVLGPRYSVKDNVSSS